MTKGAPELAARAAQIAAAERELAAAPSRGRTRPRRSRSCPTASTCPPGRSWPSLLIPASAPGRPDPDTALQKQQAAVSTGLPSGSFSTTREKKTLPAAHSEPRETAAAAFVTLSVRLVATSGVAGSPGGIPGGGANQGTDEAEKPKRAVSDYVVVGTHDVGLLGGHCIDRLQDALRCAKPLLNCRARTRSRLPN
jgi:hypothetical protein